MENITKEDAVKAMKIAHSVANKCEKINLTEEQKNWLENTVVAYMVAAEMKHTANQFVAETLINHLDEVWDSVIE